VIQIDPRDVSIYCLDWTDFDAQLKKNHDARIRDRGRGSKKYEPALPPQYEEMLAKLEFAISDEYMTEIHRNTRRAVEEWCVERSFDTDILEYCLNPGIAHIDTALYLLDDCLFDSKTHYWLNHDTTIKKIAQCVMLYKFWKHQTGGGIVWSLSKADNLLRGRGPTDTGVLEFLSELELQRQREIRNGTKAWKAFIGGNKNAKTNP
jgi:hypothetical protein